MSNINLRPYQTEAISGFQQKFREGKKHVLLVLHMGLGKTVVASRMIQLAKSNNKKVLFIAHRTFLITQCRDKLIRFGINCGIIKSKFKEDRSQPIQIASIQTLVRRDLPPADIIIIDEAHHAVSRKYMEIIQIYKDNGTAILGLTATPFLMSKKLGLNMVFDDYVNTISVSEGIEKEYLLDSKVYGMKKQLDLSGVKRKDGDYDQEELARAYSTEDVTKNVINQYHAIIGNKKSIVFCVNKEHCIKVTQALLEAGYKGSYVVDETSEDERLVHLNNLEFGDYNFMCNIGVYGEGLDCPAILCTVLIYDTFSKSKYFQTASRSGRPLPEDEGVPMHLKKKPFHIILDFGSNTKRFGSLETPFTISLEPRGNGKDGVAPIAECPNCGYMMSAQIKVCPECQFDMPVKPKTKKEIQEEEFIELDKKRLQVEQYMNLPSSRWNEIPSDLLKAFAKAKGFKTGWVNHVLLGRGEGKKKVVIKNYSGDDYFRQVGILTKAYHDKAYPIDAHTWQFIEENEKEIVYKYLLEEEQSIL